MASTETAEKLHFMGEIFQLSTTNVLFILKTNKLTSQLKLKLEKYVIFWLRS